MATFFSQLIMFDLLCVCVFVYSKLFINIY